MTWLLWGLGCQDVALSTVEHAPEADITSHDAGASVMEGYAVTLRGYVRDKDDDAELLSATWYLDGAELCGASAPSADGSTSCELLPEAGELAVKLEVVDGDGQVGEDSITLVGLSTEAPSAVISSPDEGDVYSEEELVVFAGYVDDEEDDADELVVWWESSVDGVLEVDATPDSDGEISGSGYLSAGEHQISLHVQDLTGKTDVDSLQITVEGCELFTFYTDADGDGFGDTEVQACSLPKGASEAGGDCDDADEAIHPGALEVCEDEIDQDCDGLDAGCGIDGRSLEESDAILYGELAGEQAGTDVEVVDLDGDGIGDIAAGAPYDRTVNDYSGALWLALGPLTGEHDLVDVGTKLYEPSGVEGVLGRALAGGDLDGDGLPELAAAASRGNTGLGVTYVLSGPLTSHGDVIGALTFTGEVAWDTSGRSLAVADVTGDGATDLLLGADAYDSASEDGGAVYVVAGPITESASLADAHALVLGTHDDEMVGWRLATGDFDGDGTADLATGGHSYTGVDVGGAWVVHGPITSGDQSLDDVGTYLAGERVGDMAGFCVAAGDVDGDGYDDLAVGAIESHAGTGEYGRAYLLSGPVTAGDLVDATAVMEGTVSGEWFGYDLDMADVTGDGRQDLVIGAPFDASVESEGGRVLIALGPVSGALTADELETELWGYVHEGHAGATLASGDLDGQGFEDLLISASGRDDDPSWAGAVHVFYSGL